MRKRKIESVRSPYVRYQDNYAGPYAVAVVYIYIFLIKAISFNYYIILYISHTSLYFYCSHALSFSRPNEIINLLSSPSLSVAPALLRYVQLRRRTKRREGGLSFRSDRVPSSEFSQYLITASPYKTINRLFRISFQLIKRKYTISGKMPTTNKA